MGDRIEGHICISFTTYAIYKKVERVLYKDESNYVRKKASELTHNMYQITYTLPDSKHKKSKILKMDEEQTELNKIIMRNFWVLQCGKQDSLVVRRSNFNVKKLR